MKELKKVNVNFQITLRNEKDDDFRYIKRSLCRYIHKRIFLESHNKIDYEESYINFIYDFLIQKVHQKFIKTDSYEIVLADYKEARGSLIISFALIVLGTISNYTLFKENLEKFIYDINDLFNESGFNSESFYNEEFEKETSFDKTISNITKPTSFINRYKNGIILTVALVLSSLGIFDDQIFKDHQNPNSAPLNWNMEQYIEYQIQEENEKTIYKQYDLIIEQEFLKAEIEKDTLKKEFLEGLKRQLTAVYRKWR